MFAFLLQTELRRLVIELRLLAIELRLVVVDIRFLVLERTLLGAAIGSMVDSRGASTGL